MSKKLLTIFFFLLATNPMNAAGQSHSTEPVFWDGTKDYWIAHALRKKFSREVHSCAATTLGDDVEDLRLKIEKVYRYNKGDWSSKFRVIEAAPGPQKFRLCIKNKVGSRDLTIDRKPVGYVVDFEFGKQSKRLSSPPPDESLLQRNFCTLTGPCGDDMEKKVTSLFEEMSGAAPVKDLLDRGCLRQMIAPTVTFDDKRYPAVLGIDPWNVAEELLSVGWTSEPQFRSVLPPATVLHNAYPVYREYGGYKFEDGIREICELGVDKQGRKTLGIKFYGSRDTEQEEHLNGMESLTVTLDQSGKPVRAASHSYEMLDFIDHIKDECIYARSDGEWEHVGGSGGYCESARDSIDESIAPCASHMEKAGKHRWLGLFAADDQFIKSLGNVDRDFKIAKIKEHAEKRFGPFDKTLSDDVGILAFRRKGAQYAAVCSDRKQIHRLVIPDLEAIAFIDEQVNATIGNRWLKERSKDLKIKMDKIPEYQRFKAKKALGNGNLEEAVSALLPLKYVSSPIVTMNHSYTQELERLQKSLGKEELERLRAGFIARFATEFSGIGQTPSLRTQAGEMLMKARKLGLQPQSLLVSSARGKPVLATGSFVREVKPGQYLIRNGETLWLLDGPKGMKFNGPFMASLGIVKSPLEIELNGESLTVPVVEQSYTLDSPTAR